MDQNFVRPPSPTIPRVESHAFMTSARAEYFSLITGYAHIHDCRIMSCNSGLSNFSAMRGHRMGGAATPQARTVQGIAADAAAILENLAVPWLDRFLAE
jgi:hypothetical protein